jgi:hypothetical protein
MRTDFQRFLKGGYTEIFTLWVQFNFLCIFYSLKSGVDVMLKTTVVTRVLLFLAFSFAVPAFAEEDATMHQVYLAAEAGKFNEAQSMMDKVLHDHPNSAKAHFVEAELLAKQGLLSNADVELNTAERLQPGLPFVKPETLQNLKARIASTSKGLTQENVAHQATRPAAKDWMPVILLILGIGLIVLLIVFIRSRKSTQYPSNNYSGNTPGSTMPPSGTASVMGQASTSSAGSGILGSLATGAALGAGVVAGEALMHHFIDGDKNNISPAHDNSPWGTANADSHVNQNDDMGGTDFGVADASSWDDDNSSDGGDDWS